MTGVIDRPLDGGSGSGWGPGRDLDLFAVILLLWSTSGAEVDHRSKIIAGGASAATGSIARCAPGMIGGPDTTAQDRRGEGGLEELLGQIGDFGSGSQDPVRPQLVRVGTPQGLESGFVPGQR